MPSELDEVGTIAAELGKAYKRMVTFYQEQMGMDADAAHRQALTPPTNAADRPVDQVTWLTLSQLADQHPDQAYALWERAKAEARAELTSGHRAALGLEGLESSLWERARFIMLRQSFIDEWQPAGGLELALIDVLAQTHSAYLFWFEVLTTKAMYESVRGKHDYEERGKWVPERVSDQQAIDNAAQMVDRFNRLFMRTLRQLRDLRRYTVVVQNAGQVNVGGQQVNVNGGESIPLTT